MVNILNSEFEPIINREEAARAKIEKNPYKEPFPYWHSTQVGRLADILQEGLIAGEFAQRIQKKGYSSRERKPVSRKFVSLAHADPRIIPAPEVGIILDPEKIRVISPQENPPEGTVVEDFKNLHHHEILVSRRIAPREFCSLVIGEHVLPIGDDPYDFSLGFEKPLNPQTVINIMQTLDPRYVLPIYFRGELIWPK